MGNGEYHQRRIVNDECSRQLLQFINEALGTGFDYGYIYGDANGDEIINIFDVIYLISYFYLGGLTPGPHE